MWNVLFAVCLVSLAFALDLFEVEAEVRIGHDEHDQPVMTTVF